MNSFSNETVTAVEAAFETRYAVLPVPRGLTEALDKANPQERICLLFFYAYMPVSDISSYPVHLFVQLTRQALAVRNLNLYGEKISDAIFLNYILCCRVNNENLEYNRDYIFNELRGRIIGQSAERAALTVNYWCLEKATYESSSLRTASPLTLMKSTKGRCGEESVLTVSALRAVGLPARQVYTPRWAHCESNHAWVEVYVGGKWRFYGACEPEPVLDKSWFTFPASRGLLFYTTQFSPICPEGEEIIYTDELTCTLNRTAKYVQNTCHLTVRVTNSNKNVRVRVQMVSGCGFYSLLNLRPDASGRVSVLLGRGDIYLHITDGEKLLTHKTDLRREKDITLDFANATTHESNVPGGAFFMAPVNSDYTDPDYKISTAAQAEHEARLRRANERREAYAATFPGTEEALTLAAFYPPDHFDGGKYFEAVKGNLAEIEHFMAAPFPVKYKYLMLESLENKDFLDIEADTLTEHLSYAMPYADFFNEEIFKKYILCPRVEIEMITPYRKYIHQFFDATQRKRFAKDPALLWTCIRDNINDAPEYQNDNDHRILTASPTGVLSYGHGGLLSQKILFVAACRTLGVPARLKNGVAQYWKGGAFFPVGENEYSHNDVMPDSPNPENEATHAQSLTLTLQAEEPLVYYENITLAKLENGLYRTLQYTQVHPEGAFALPAGYYRITTGKRLENGTMSVQTMYIQLTDKNETLTLLMPGEENQTPSTRALKDYKFDDCTLFDLLTGRDLIAAVYPHHEPTEHILRELTESRETYKRQRVRVLLVAAGDSESLRRVRAAYDGDLIVKHDDHFISHLAAQTGLSAKNPPLMVLAGKNGAIEYSVQGYHVGSVRLALAYA